MTITYALMLARAALALLAPAGEDEASELLRLLRHPLPAKLDRVPLTAPDDVRAELPFTVRIGARLYRTDLEDVEEHEPGTEVFAPASEGAIRLADGRVVQEVKLRTRTVRLTLTGLDVARPDRALGPSDPVGTLSRTLLSPYAEPALAELGYLPGPHLLLRIDGLFPDDEKGRRGFAEFARERLLPALARAPSPRPATRPPHWPAPSERTLRGYVESRGRSGPLVSPEPAAAKELGFFLVSGDGERRLRQRGPVFERLLESFLRGLRWPLPSPAGLSRFTGGDDGFGRDDYFEHRAVDLGSRLKDESGAFFVWPADAHVFPLHTGLAGTFGTIETSEGDHRLRLALRAWHVRPGGGKDGSIGALEPFDAGVPLGGWRTSDPYLRLIGAPKGNHVHAVVRGLLEDEGDARREAMNERVFAAWLAAPGPEAPPERQPLAVPLPGDGSSEDRDPRGAAVLRAGLRLLARQIRALSARSGGCALVPDHLPPLDAARGPWTARLAVLDPRSPFAGDSPERPRWPMQRTLRATAGGRSLAIELRLSDLGSAGEGDDSRLLELEVAGPLPEGAAWVRASLLPVLVGK